MMDGLQLKTLGCPKCGTVVPYPERTLEREQAVRIAELEGLVSMVYDAWCFECDPFADDFACAYFDGSECSVRKRMAELGLGD